MNDDLTGMTLGHCVIERMLGQGGMARVYKGRQENLDRAVAIKVLPPYYAADPAFVERFKLEARAMARLSHPNIVTVHDAGEDSGRLYIIMEYIGGGTLKQAMLRTMP
ncbi:MAG: serine/threonine protein kinase, partial [Ktedonobacterales bacterium]